MNKKSTFYKAISLLMITVLLMTGIDVPRSQAASRPALSAKKITLTVGKMKKLRVKKVKTKQIKKLRFTSNRKKVAKVSQSSGKVKAVKAGTAKITCKLTLKNNRKYTLKCTVKVKKAQGNTGDDDISTVSTQNPGPAGTTAAVVTNSPAPSSGPSAASTNPPTPGQSADTGSTNAPSASFGPSDPPGAATKSPAPSAAPTDSGTTTAPGGDPTAVPENTEGPVATPGQTPSASAAPEPLTGKPKRTRDPAELPQATPHLSANGIQTIDDGTMRSNMTAFDIQHEMGLGINLGNTLESCGTWINGFSVAKYEQAWGAPLTTQEMITGMWEAGFNSVRIPVSWSNMLSADGRYTINEAYFNRVEEIMNYAFNEGMYVIVNIHYDGGWWGQFGSADQAVRQKAWNRFESLWTQIAARYKGYSDHLIFESANEELGHRLNDELDAQGEPYQEGSGDPVAGVLTEDQCYQMLHDINQKFVDIVRSSGGNNATRHLLLAGYDTDIKKTCDGRYKMPTDTIENHMMVSIHYYDPVTYCLVTDRNNSWGYSDSWGSAGDIKDLQSTLSSMKKVFCDRGIPVVIGEYAGACVEEIAKDSYRKKEGRALLYTALCTYALQNGMCPVLWDIQFTNPSDGIYDRIACEMIVEEEAQDFYRLSELAENTPVYAPVPQKDTLVWNGTISCSGWNPGSPVAADGENDFVMAGIGGCYQISAVDWSQFTNPVLTMHAVSISGSADCYIAKADKLVVQNEYWSYLENSAKVGTWTFSSDYTYDLSELKLSEMDSLYLCLKGGTDFAGAVELSISEKK